ncbi:Gfo/Idh/MocA family oxidoreductase [Thermus filiformis]|uniref:Oxidoreductase n=1 Tax=Thermus filiformis TaxID=276 RepID=A0A0A2WRF6_THEFI|nr:Gfo/Idh/MocA family oxidoreductase [Thermus filiformis]KGQ22408.1 oxidoreductase [Thermus filiformis]
MKFALIGAAGYIAPRHLKAIREVGGDLLAALDPFDAVGVLDSYFPQAAFFTQTEELEAHLEDHPVDWVSIASPNHLHEAHVRLAFRHGADALCEKPLVTEVAALERLKALEERTGRRVYTVLQLRVHPALLALKERLDRERGIKEVVLTYVTGRGPWYLKSWKGDVRKSGGLATNIGIHFFDLLAWFFGPAEHLEVHARTDTVAAGYLALARARVRWFLSIDPSFVPEPQRSQGKRTYRSIAIEGEEVEFSEGFTDLHTEVYRRTLAGKGFGLEDTWEAIRLTEAIRHKEVGGGAFRHPFLEG